MPKAHDCPFSGCQGGCTHCQRIVFEAQENETIVELYRMAQAWADFGDEKNLRGAMRAMEIIGRSDYAEVLRSGWVEQKRALSGATDVPAPTGQRCPHDGGKCHHHCQSRCFRKEAFMSLSQPWEGFPRDGDAPVPCVGKESDAGST